MKIWAIELSEFDISYEPRKELKAQVFVDIVAITTTEKLDITTRGTLFVDMLSNTEGRSSIRFEFPTLNNQLECDECLAGLWVVFEIRAIIVKIKLDSHLVISQV